MIGILQMLLAFIVALGVLITFHEFGHFWVARRCNVKVLQFAVGFGRPLWRRKFGADDTEFVIGMVPLGGYVRMLDEREAPVSAAEQGRAFNNKSLGQRFAIVAAGPIFNFIFAILAYWLVFIIGITGLKPVLGSVQDGKPVAQSGLQAGDEIIAIDGQATPTWNTALEYLVAGVVEGDAATLRVRDGRGAERALTLDLGAISIDAMAAGNLLDLLGFEPARPRAPATLGQVSYQGAAWRGGLREADEIVAVDGVPVQGWQHWVELIRAAPDTPMTVTIARDGATIDMVVTPEAKTSEQGERIGFIGVGLDPAAGMDDPLLAREAYPWHQAAWKGVVKTIDMSVMTLQILGRMITGQASLKNLSGPVSIAQYAGQTAQLGIVAFLGFLALVSISLGILNLLPIPMLDGGHLCYYLVEFVKGSPVSDTVQLLAQRVGLALLFSLMALAIYNDVLRLVG